MYFIQKEEELLGKTIAFTHMAQFAEKVVIVTEDKGFVVLESDGETIEILNEPYALRYVMEQRYVRQELEKLGLFSPKVIEEYEEKKRQEQKERRLRQQQELEKQERQTYERLRAKFEPQK